MFCFNQVFYQFCNYSIKANIDLSNWCDRSDILRRKPWSLAEVELQNNSLLLFCYPFSYCFSLNVTAKEICYHSVYPQKPIRTNFRYARQHYYQIEFFLIMKTCSKSYCYVTRTTIDQHNSAVILCLISSRSLWCLSGWRVIIYYNRTS